MGNQLSTDESYTDPDLQGRGDVSFFRSLDVKWINYFFAKVNCADHGGSRANSITARFDLGDGSQVLTWREYFAILSDIRDRMAKEKDRESRQSWHPSTLGYIMERRDARDGETESTTESKDADVVQESEIGGVSMDDGYTDDEPSDDEANEEPPSDDEANESNGSVGSREQGDKAEQSAKDGTIEETVVSNPSRAKAEARAKIKTESNGSDKQATTQLVAAVGRWDQQEGYKKGWNPHVTNPIFFGFSHKTVEEHDTCVAQERMHSKQREQRAIATAKSSRLAMLDVLEKAIQSQASSR
jgi:hypothetical protein